MKVKVRVNPNGIFSVVSASLVEKHVSRLICCIYCYTSGFALGAIYSKVDVEARKKPQNIPLLIFR